MIEARDLTKRFGDQLVLAGVDLVLPAGVTAIVGPNGCGKTTLGEILLGLQQADAGNLSGLDGLRTAAVFQTDRLCPQLTAIANVRLVAPELSTDAIRAAFASVGLAPSAQDRPVSELSGGESRRVAIVRGLLADADLVVLDEPFSGIDAEHRDLIRAWTAARLAGRTALLITHDPADATALGARVLRWSDAPMRGAGAAA